MKRLPLHRFLAPALILSLSAPAAGMGRIPVQLQSAAGNAAGRPAATAPVAPIVADAPAAPVAALELARDGKTAFHISMPAAAAAPVRLAAAELTAYLQRLSGAAFPVVTGAAAGPAIVLRVAAPAAVLGTATSASDTTRAAHDAYRIELRGDSLVLTGAAPRALLFAAYDLLERLGCHWLAPQFAFYDGHAEVIPRQRVLTYRAQPVVIERPTFAIREFDVGQGSSHDLQSMLRLVEYLPKLRLNQLQVPMTMGRRASWDDWREALAVELERRGITLEVGGHGYQNFLSAEHEDGRLFQLHPDWFGLDADCRRTPAEDVVFDTDNADAVAYLTRNVVRYVTEHPEIDIFEFWPPDVARWDECQTDAPRGSPQDRQARLVNHVQQAVRAARPDLRLQVIAYQDALLPPVTPYAADVLVDFCPIDQSFDSPISDSANARNRLYAQALARWRRAFAGDIGVYTYYRKYAWRSLPVLLPHYIQHDFRYYAAVPVQGVSMYAEPADWFTYEVNYLAFAALAWNPDADVDALLARYTAARFGPAAAVAGGALRLLEEEYRLHGSVPFSAPDSASALSRTRAALLDRLASVRAAAQVLPAAAPERAHLERLALMLDFAARDLALQLARTQRRDIRRDVAQLVAFMHEHAARGVFLARSGDEARLTKHYTRESTVLPEPLLLAEGGRTDFTISLAESAGAAEQLAAEELAGYLGRITGARFPIVRGEPAGPAIVLRRGRSVATAHIAGEAYAIAVRDGSLHLTGGSGRALLYAAYHLLERLGCRWLAPALPFYQGDHEFVPSRATLTWNEPADIFEHPAFSIRKLDVEEGLSHDEASLRAIVAWLPKLRFNTLQVPLDYGGSGRVRWDAWRDALTPELDRRELLIEVGGHGFHNFINPELEGGRLFELHPDWFGRDAQCRPSREPHLVFDTENQEAVAYLVRNLLAYLAERPEIDIFDFWPPDGARWAECADWVARGTPEDRQARLVNQVAAAVREKRPDVRLQIIAYAHAKNPPATVALDPAVLVDFCPIGQNFDAQIFDTTASNNATYVRTLAEWQQRFSGQLGLYSYYRRYAWRSLPVILPRYMQQDLRWWAELPAAAASTYGEPGDWGTYEVNHYMFGRLAWQPSLSLDEVLNEYLAARYGEAAAVAGRALAALEDIVRVHGSIQYSRPSTVAAIDRARRELLARQQALHATGATTPALQRLDLMLEFAIRDLELQSLRTGGAEPQLIEQRVAALVALLTRHADRGVFLLRGRGDLDRYRRHYGLN